MIVAQRLLEARAIRGITATTVADRAGLGRPQLSVYESGEAVPRIETLVRLADALDVDLDYLAGRTPKPVSRGENACSLASRISGLSEADRRLAELWLDTLAAARRGGDPNADLRLRKRIEAVRSQNT